jgi:hypothetical protein
MYMSPDIVCSSNPSQDLSKLPLVVHGDTQTHREPSHEAGERAHVDEVVRASR